MIKRFLSLICSLVFASAVPGCGKPKQHYDITVINGLPEEIFDVRVVYPDGFIVGPGYLGPGLTKTELLVPHALPTGFTAEWRHRDVRHEHKVEMPHLPEGFSGELKVLIRSSSEVTLQIRARVPVDGPRIRNGD